MSQNNILHTMLDSIVKFSLKLEQCHIDMALNTINNIESDFANYKNKNCINGDTEYLSHLYNNKSYDIENKNDNTLQIRSVINSANKTQNIDGIDSYIQV